MIFALFGGTLCFDFPGERSANETSWRFTEKGYQFDAKNLTVNETFRTAVTTVNGMNEILPHIIILSIRYQTVHRVPEDLDKFFPNVEALQIFNSELKILEQKDLKPFDNLKELWVHQNELESLSGDLFKFNTELQLIVLNNNRLRFIGKYILVPLTKLEIANFNSNKCIDKYAGFPHKMHELFIQIEKNCAPPENLVQMFDARAQALIQAKEPEDNLTKFRNEVRDLREKLRQTEVKLNLSDGHLDAATKNLFAASKALESQGNSREEFLAAPTESQFVDLFCYTNTEDVCEVIELKIRFNDMKIREVKTMALDKIRKLSIVQQQTLFLPSNLAEHFKELTELTVTLSGLFTIKWNVFRDLRKLKSLDLPHNKIQEVPSNAFEDLERLTDLDLSFNNIESIDTDGFANLAKLQQLKLNNNDLSVLSGKPFENLKKLKQLFLQKNSLKVIDGNLLAPLTKLVTADFTNNECINISLPRKSLEALDKAIREKCSRRP